jgi:hypothetical protein
MGLDIFTSESAMRVGSYSGVQLARIKAIEFFIQKLEQIEPKLKEEHVSGEEDDVLENLRELHEKLKASIDGTEEAGCPNYGHFPVTNFVYARGLTYDDHNFTGKARIHDCITDINRALCGLNAWVDHSDCDGVHSPGQAKDVANCLEWFADQVPKESDHYLDNAEYWEMLTEFYKQAATNDEIIQFG